jgi:hypothetical protein
VSSISPTCPKLNCCDQFACSVEKVIPALRGYAPF